MCQCPKRAFLISTYGNPYEVFTHKQCVNALNGPFSFLHKVERRGKKLC